MSRADPIGALAVEHVTVIPLDRQRSLPDQTVLVSGGRVQWIGAAAAAKLTAETTRIDGRGRFLIPGLADMHAHPQTETDLLLAVRYGLTTLRNMAGFPRHVRWSAEIERGELLGPSIYNVSPIVDGMPPMRVGVITMEAPANGPGVAKRLKRAGFRDVKIYDQLPRQLYDALTDAARSEGLRIVGHIPFRVGLHRALEARQRSIEHAYGYVEAMQPPGSPLRECTLDPRLARQALADAVTRPSDALIRELAAETYAAGVWNCPTMMIRRRHMQSIEELRVRPANRYIDPMALARWREFKLTYPYDLAHKANELEIVHRVINELHRLGAGLLAGTDSPIHYLVMGASLHEELEEFVASGLTPYETLEIASKSAARFLEQEQEWGTIAVGKRADLVLLDADPLVDVRNTTSIAGVVLRGRWWTVDELDRRILAAEAARADRRRGKTDGAAKGGLRFEVRWGDFIQGREEVTVREDAAGRTVVAEANLDAYGQSTILLGASTVYRSEVRYDAKGRAIGADLESASDDGTAHFTLTREDDRISVRREGAAARDEDESHELGREGMLGYAFTSAYIEVAHRARSLAVGSRIDVDLLGPGNGADFDVLPTRYAIERLADEDGQPRFSFVVTRANRAPLTGLLTCRADGTPEQIRFDLKPTELSPNAKAPGQRVETLPMVVQRVAAP